MQTTTPEALACYLIGCVAGMKQNQTSKSVVLMLVGPPGSGKTFARKWLVDLLAATGVPTVVVSQDDHGGSASATKAALNAALFGLNSSALAKAQKDLAKMLLVDAGALPTAAARATIESKIATAREQVKVLQHQVDSRAPNVVIVDRCNADKAQRSWVRAAALQAKASIVALVLTTPLALAAERAALRKGHPTLKSAALAFNVSLKFAEAFYRDPPRVPDDADVIFAIGQGFRADSGAGTSPCVFDASATSDVERLQGPQHGEATQEPEQGEVGKEDSEGQASRNAVQLTYAGWFLPTGKDMQDVQALETPPGQLRVALPHVTVAYGAETNGHLGRVGDCARFSVRHFGCST